MSNFFKKNKRILTIASTSIIIGSIVGAGIGAIISISNNDEKITTKYKFESKQIFPGGPVIKIANIKGSGYSDASPEYWLSDAEFDSLVTKIKNELGYGPEIFQLKSITIGDGNHITSKEDGLYITGNAQIFINSQNFAKKISRWKGATKKEISDIKVESLFEVIFHEYGHHLAFSYLKNAPTKSSETDSSILENGSASNWNKDFSEKFQKYLNYKDWNRNHKKYSDKVFIQENKRLKSIGSIYSQEDLFVKSNKVPNYDWNKLNDPQIDGYVFSNNLDAGGNNTNLNFRNPQGLLITRNVINKENIPYLYSIDELFTRKYQQLNEVYNPINTKSSVGYQTYGLKSENNPVSISDILRNSMYYQNGMGYKTSSQNIITTHNLEEYYNYLKQAVPNQKITDEKNEILKWKNDYSISNRFLYDAPFGNSFYNNMTPDYHNDLYNLMDSHMGHSRLNNISFIWPKNDISLYEYDNYYNDISDDIKSDFVNKIKFGGYINTPLSNKDSYDSIGYMDSSGYKKISNISTHEYTYRHKDSLLGNIVSLSDPNKTFYVTKDWIKSDEILNKELYFHKKNGLTTPLNSVRGYNNNGTKIIAEGTTTNYFPSQIRLTKTQNTIEAVMKNGKVIVKKAGKLWQ